MWENFECYVIKTNYLYLINWQLMLYIKSSPFLGLHWQINICRKGDPRRCGALTMYGWICRRPLSSARWLMWRQRGLRDELCHYSVALLVQRCMPVSFLMSLVCVRRWMDCFVMNLNFLQPWYPLLNLLDNGPVVKELQYALPTLVYSLSSSLRKEVP